VFGIRLRSTSTKKQLAQVLGDQLTEQLPAILREFGREELASTCKAHGLPAKSISRQELIESLLLLAGLDPADSVKLKLYDNSDGLPCAGQIVRARHRQWLVEEVAKGGPFESPRVVLVCLDDDDPGRRLEVLWDLELGAQIIEPEKRGLGEVKSLDQPEYFGAYLHALRWNTVSAADAKRFQAPFRAGIQHMTHQLTPLMKALELPRANLFIADDVGLGKTIEAGLVMQELILRQQANFVLISCPASICLQWQSEMRRRFGLHFEVMTRAFVAQRRRQRGFGVNPWTTHHRFIISHALLRRPEYLELLLLRLGDREQKSLLVLDEAHVAAPATRSRYAVDSEITGTIRDLAPRFDNRLFLSATPHNGHSNSFSALLEILDPVRFTRGVPVDGKNALAPIMVRRLKRDLKKLGIHAPERVLIQVDLAHENGEWSAQGKRSDGQSTEVVSLGAGDAVDLEVSRMLARYTQLCAPEKGPRCLPFIRLQQRLLSSPEAFARSLEVHAAAVQRQGGVRPKFATVTSIAPESDADLYGPTDEAIQADADADLAAESAELSSPTEEATALLAAMRAAAERARRAPDAKVRALLAWMREHLCPAIGREHDKAASRQWSQRRVILFTEWADTKRYLVELLREAIGHTDQPEERIASFAGGLDDQAREEIQRRFNTAPDQEPLRILVATDAAREGINLQAHCADLFHIDLPWNPGRLEQRNGRIDRTLQPAAEVRCHYFVYKERAEDRVLETLVRKIDVVQRELGSLGGVLLEQMEDAFSHGIRDGMAGQLESLGKDRSTQSVESEFESTREEQVLREEQRRAGQRYEESKSALEVSPEALRRVVDVGLRLAGTSGLTELKQQARESQAKDTQQTFRIPELDRSWEVTLDTLRPPRPRGEPLYEWRKRAPLPVTFTPVERLTGDVEQIHLAHPFTRRVLDRFLAQGFAAHDLQRVAAVIDPDSGQPVVIGYARLTLFGSGAARLHDEIIAVAATWDGSLENARSLERLKEVRTFAVVKRTEELLAANAEAPKARNAKAIVASATTLLASLWRPLEIEADARSVQAKNGLQARARAEADGMRKLLTNQRTAIQKTLKSLHQHQLFDGLADSGERREQERQLALDMTHMKRRDLAIETDLVREPAAIESLYDVRLSRLTPVGLVVSWPKSWL
jgi:superfamily II DNA or RNA helicase